MVWAGRGSQGLSRPRGATVCGASVLAFVPTWRGSAVVAKVVVGCGRPGVWRPLVGLLAHIECAGQGGQDVQRSQEGEHADRLHPYHC